MMKQTEPRGLVYAFADYETPVGVLSIEGDSTVSVYPLPPRGETPEGSTPVRHRAAEIVVQAGAEGGVITLFRHVTPQGDLEYFTELSYEGFEDVPGVHEHQSRRVKTLEEGFTLLDSDEGSTWHRLYPVHVHADCAADVLRAVEERMSQERLARGGDSNEEEIEFERHVLDPWRRRCGGTDG